MKLRDEDLPLASRKALVKRVLRIQADNGAIEEYDYLVMQGRIEQAQSRDELDALQTEVEGMGR